MKYCDYCPRRNGECYRLEEHQRVDISIETVENDLIDALNRIYTENYDLIERKINERCITNYLFHYFLTLNKEKYEYYDIDAEYSKNGESKKEFDDSYAYPDMIIHKRNCNNENLLYVEVKSNKKNDSGDNKKLRSFTRDNSIAGVKNKKNYHYVLGVGIALFEDRVVFTWYKLGKKIGANTYEAGKSGIVK